MKKYIFLLLFSLSISFTAQDNNKIDANKLHEDFGKLMQDISENYIFLKNKNTDIDCIIESYSKIIPQIKTHQDKVLFFEYILNEFYDHQLVLDTKTKLSYRLHSPLFVSQKNNKFYIDNIWFSNVKDYSKNILGAEVINFNGKNFQKVIDDFPVQCVDKTTPEVRQWIANKIISGRFNKSRILTLELKDKRRIVLNVNNIKIKNNSNLISVTTKNNIAILKINNSLGNHNLIKNFDLVLDKLHDHKGLVLDLRNTISSGSTYVTNAILSRFIDIDLSVQKITTHQKVANNPTIQKSMIESITPRGKLFKKPMVVLVGKWTMGVAESLAIGLSKIKNIQVIGTEMRSTSGLENEFSFKHSQISYKIPTQKITNLNGVLRENFMPQFYIPQTSILQDDQLSNALNLINGKMKEGYMVALEN